MQSVEAASEALTAAVDNVKALTDHRTASLPDVRLASLRLAVAAVEYRTAIVLQETAARNAARPSWASLITPTAWGLWRR